MLWTQTTRPFKLVPRKILISFFNRCLMILWKISIFRVNVSALRLYLRVNPCYSIETVVIYLLLARLEALGDFEVVGYNEKCLF